MECKDTLDELHKHMSVMDYKHAKNCIATLLVKLDLESLTHDELSSLICDSVDVGATKSILLFIRRLRSKYLEGYATSSFGGVLGGFLGENANCDINLLALSELTEREESAIYFIRYILFKNEEDLNRSYQCNNYNLSAVYELYMLNKPTSLKALSLLFATKDIAVDCRSSTTVKGLHLEVLGGGNEVGRSCYAIRTSTESIIVDCGAKIEKDGLSYPDFDNHEDLIKSTKVCVITHSHLDHCGGMFELYKRNPSIRFIMSEATLTYLKYNFADYDFVDTLEFNNMLNRVILVSDGESITLSENTKLSFYRAGHILGALGVLIESDSIKTYFTGDYSIDSFNTVRGMNVPDVKVDYLISEHTYSNFELQDSRGAQRNKFKEYVVSKLREGKKILIPSFTIGRTQEVVSILNEISSSDIDNIYVDGSSIDATEDYKSLTGRDLKYSKRYSTVDKVTFIKNNFLQGKNCMVCSSGMLHEGSASYNYLQNLISNPECVIILTGYQGEGTVGRELLKVRNCNKEYIDLGELKQVKCEIENFSLSAHCYNNEILALVHTLQPSNIVFIHGDGDCSIIKERIKNCNVIVSKNIEYDI